MRRVTCFRELSEVAEELSASDLFVTERSPVFALVKKELTPVSRPLTKRDLETILVEAFGHQGVFAPLARAEECDFTAFEPSTGVRFRVNVALSFGKPFAVFRRLSEINRSPQELGVPEPFVSIAENYGYGLVLVIGPTGSGKSTTLASVLAELLRKHAKTVVTIEDPIEYLIPSGRGIVFQREVGRDTKSFTSGLRAAMRERPNVILVGEIRDRDTALASLAAAETGHLVFATLHAKDVAVVSERICGFFSPDEAREVRFRLSEVLVGVLAQTLVRGRNGKVFLATEFLEVTGDLRPLILRQDRRSIREILKERKTRLADGLKRLVLEGLITEEQARGVANDLEEIDEVFRE